jgi:hypothetical protein
VVTRWAFQLETSASFIEERVIPNSVAAFRPPFSFHSLPENPREKTMEPPELPVHDFRVTLILKQK